jgi:hypothetical protein
MPLECHEILSIAHSDTVSVWKELSDYRITLELRPDGWHVDYDLTRPLVSGGGPHYVIDPTTGKIVSKVYEL